MSKAKKKITKRTNTKTQQSKATSPKNNSRASLSATLEKELLKTLAALHDNAHKKLSTLTKEVNQLKTKLVKTIAQKKAPLKKELEKVKKELSSANTIKLKATALKKLLQKFEKDWIKNQSKKARAKKSIIKKKKIRHQQLPLELKENHEVHPLISIQHDSNRSPAHFDSSQVTTHHTNKGGF